MSTVWITGASSGIGAQLAIDFAERGWNVIACGRSQEKLEKLTQSHERIVASTFDITNPEEVEFAIEAIDQKPDCWVLNAGDCLYIDEGVINVDTFKHVMEVNFMGTINCLQAIQTRLRPGDHVVLTGSIASELALPRAEAYGASKAALNYLFRSLQHDWKTKNIDMSLVMPGFVDTPLTKKNNFPMPMCISVEQASKAMLTGILAKKPYIYFPRRFTGIIRFLSILPKEIQRRLVAHLVRS
ncbi:SDR family NAD(P)-dependent oxidoreductase [Vibrio viridaestus]|uniref:SDR family NAD(P)-dependent oxidoreductase n=2 Tax=Vibrio viridaestus TaxID=2487322 RepID=A0A3N9TCS0_9VIBR|nr:SDR family NAD(P)-dependent oxidoreductase [Vibrio viridaestus]